jgi:hypothetical protein
MSRLITCTAGFTIGFAVATFGTSVAAAYLLGWYDPKWGGPARAVQTELQFLPLFLLPGLIGHAAGLAAMWTRLGRLARRSVIFRAASAGATTQLLWAASVYFQQRGLPGSGLAKVIEAASLGWLLLLGALSTVASLVARPATMDDALSRELPNVR